ncbi:MAG: DUF3575 domain-containing protein [Muribaculaceae bacterium]|nr:DUF3575 domain-containing protein [Muribaculaceae bacterium]
MRLIAFALVVMTTFATFGINCADSVKVCFRVGQSQFDPSLGDNLRAMDSFITNVREAAESGDIERIVVHGYASPDGNPGLNERLAHNRCASIADYIASTAGVSKSLIEERPEGVAWKELRDLVEANADVPSRLKVLYILDHTPVWIFDSAGKIVDGRKKQLMDLNGGRPYNWMLTNLFPQLRNAVAVTLYLRHAPEQALNEAETVEAMPANDKAEPSMPEASEPADTVVVPTEATPAGTTSVERRRHHFAVKTNLLYDAVLLPNLEFEWLINKNWSVSIDGNVAWWKPEFTRVYRLALVSPEVRYHINPRELWRGMYVGCFAGGGLYQLENRHDGYRGEGGMGGFSFGYMWPVGKHLLFDTEIGVGYLYSRYKVYQSIDSHKLYMRTKSLNYFGPLKLKFSIAWRFDITTKKSAKVSSAL